MCKKPAPFDSCISKNTILTILGNPTGTPGPAVSGSSASSPIDVSTTTAVIQGRKSVIAEVYDEVILQDPTQYMYTLLTTTRKLTLSAYKHETNVEERRDRSLVKIKVCDTDMLIGVGRGQ